MFYFNYQDEDFPEKRLKFFSNLVSSPYFEISIDLFEAEVEEFDKLSKVLRYYNYYYDSKKYLKEQECRSLEGLRYYQIEGILTENCQIAINILSKFQDKKVVELLLEFIYTSLATTKRDKPDDMVLEAIGTLLMIDSTDKNYVSLFIHLLRLANFEATILQRVISNTIRNSSNIQENSSNFLLGELDKAGFLTIENSNQVDIPVFSEYEPSDEPF